MNKISFRELQAYMMANNKRIRPRKIAAIICVKPGRLYIVNNENPIFKGRGQELFGTRVDESEICIRLDLNINPDDIEYCQILGERK